MTLGRLRQVTAAIRLRTMRAERRHRALVSWQTRTLAVTVAATVPVDPKKRENPLLDQAKTTAVDDEERRWLAKVAKEAPPIENKEGSFEKFMLMTGRVRDRSQEDR